MRTENSVHEQTVLVTFCVFRALEWLFYFIRQTLLNYKWIGDLDKV